ncbi:hypothetical protein N9L68_00275 [bacterium]|nr:hypothetical protein [bacterium]
MGDNRCIYLSKKDFERYGYTGGGPGCRDIASGKNNKYNAVAPHTVACRRKIDASIQESDPDRWERLLLRQKQDEAVREGSEGAEPASGSGVPAVTDGVVTPQNSEPEDDGW